MASVAKEIISVNLEDEMRRSYLDYAMSVIVGRALPDVRDGLKPVHRRALFAMSELNNAYNRGYMKSARIVGDVIGLWPTLAMILVTAIIGSVLLRVQGFGIVNRIQSELQANRVPARDLIHGVMIMIAGVLLLTPGFITDSLGFLLFVPPIRDWAWSMIKSRVNVSTMGGTAQRGQHHHPSSAKDGTIDLDEEDYRREPDSNSPWADDSKPRIDER